MDDTIFLECQKIKPDPAAARLLGFFLSCHLLEVNPLQRLQLPGLSSPR